MEHTIHEAEHPQDRQNAPGSLSGRGFAEARMSDSAKLCETSGLRLDRGDMEAFSRSNPLSVKPISENLQNSLVL